MEKPSGASEDLVRNQYNQTTTLTPQGAQKTRKKGMKNKSKKFMGSH